MKKVEMRLSETRSNSRLKVDVSQSGISLKKVEMRLSETTAFGSRWARLS